MTVFRLVSKEFRANGVYLLASFSILFVLSTGLTFGALGAESPAVNGEPESAFTVALPVFFLIAVIGAKMISLLFLKVDEMSDTSAFYASLPVTRGETVKAGYIGSALLALMAVTTYLLGTLPAYLIHGDQYQTTFKLLHHPFFWWVCFLFVLCANALSFPLYFRLGLGKGALIMVVSQVFIAILLLTIILNSNLMKVVFDFVEQAFLWLDLQLNIILIVGSFGLTLLLMKGSEMLSSKLYKTRDL